MVIISLFQRILLLKVADNKTQLITIGKDGLWYIDGISTNVNAMGVDGNNGETPTISIGPNGNWIINGNDSGVKALGADGNNGTDAPKIISIVQTSTSFIFFFDNGTNITAQNNKKKVLCWGDSLTADLNGWTKTLQALLGDDYIVVNCGVGGEDASTILGRQGGLPMYIPYDVVLPSDGSEIVIANGSEFSFLKSLYDDNICAPLIQGDGNSVNPVSISGIECTLTKYQIDDTGPFWSGNNNKWTIKRNKVSTRDVKIPTKTLIYTKGAKEFRNPYAEIFFVGQNGGWSSETDLANKLDMAIDFSGCSNYLIIGLSSGTKDSRNVLESHFNKHFGLRFVNLREYLSTDALYDSGITPTQDDLDLMSVGSVPLSLRSDGVHFNSKGHFIIGNLLFGRMSLLGIF